MANNIPKDYELPVYLFHDGTNYETYKFLGCHKGEMMGLQGYFSEYGLPAHRLSRLWVISTTGTSRQTL